MSTYLEDLAVGQVYESGTVDITADGIKAFAREFDPQPFHLDEEAAKGTIFAGLAASGWYTASLTMRMLVTGKLHIAGGLVGAGVEEIRWPRPVRPGDVLHARSEVVSVRVSQSRPDRGIVQLRTTTLNQDDQAVQMMVANLVVPRRPTALLPSPDESSTA